MSKFEKRSKNCYFCAVSVLFGEGIVFFCKVIKNKEFCGKSFCKVGIVVFVELIKSIGIDVYIIFESDVLLCKKCVRKIVNCFVLFYEL